MLALCASVQAQCEGATEVRKGKTHSPFTPVAGRDYIPPGFFIVRTGKAKKKKKNEEWLVKCHAASCINTYKERWQGLFTGQLSVMNNSFVTTVTRQLMNSEQIFSKADNMHYVEGKLQTYTTVFIVFSQLLRIMTGVGYIPATITTYYSPF